jgi:Lrp/AsnC family transcriptional regulator for asnA, asnC and gidA
LISNKNDLKLIAEMQKNGIASYSDLAAKLGIAPKTVAKRVGGLIKSKAITVRAQPNPYKLGLSAGAVIAIKADPSKIEQVCDLLCEHFCVNLVQTVFGRFDIMAICVFPHLGIAP